MEVMKLSVVQTSLLVLWCLPRGIITQKGYTKSVMFVT